MILLAAQHRRAEHLVFEIAVVEPGILSQVQHFPGLRHGARQRLLAGDSENRAASRLYLAVECPHDVEPRVVRRENPDRVDVGGREQRFKAVMRATPAEIKRLGFAHEALAVCGTAAVDAGHLDIAHADERIQVKMRNETRADEADTQGLFR